MATGDNSHGMIAVDKMGGKILFLDPVTYETEIVIEPFRAPCMNCSSCRRPASLMCRSSAMASTAATPIPASALHHRPQ